MRKRIAMALFIVIVLTGSFGTLAYAGLKELMEVGRNQAAIAKALKKETKNYNKVKKAIISGKLIEGMTADKIRKRYGEPIIEIYDKKKDAYKWLYMPATSSHFEGEKLYLFIDKEDKLVGWKLVNQQEPAE